MPYGGPVNASTSNSVGNGVINGDCSICQINAVNTNTPVGVLVTDWFNDVDMFAVSNTGPFLAGNLLSSQRSDHPILGANGFCKSVIVNGAIALPGAAQESGIFTAIEGANFQPFVGQTAILNFWVKSPKTGIHCVAFTNNVDRSYVAEYVVAAANTWQQQSVGLLFNYVGGTWDYTTGLGLKIAFPLSIGANFKTAPYVWQNGLFYGTANQQNLLDTVGNTFRVTDVQLTQGIISGAFVRPPFNQQLLYCQRYYAQSFPYRTVPAANAGATGAIIFNNSVPAYESVPAGTIEWPQPPNTLSSQIAFPVELRVPPLVNLFNPVSASANQINNITSRIASLAQIATTSFSISTGGFTLIVNGEGKDLRLGDILQTHYTAFSRLQ